MVELRECVEKGVQDSNKVRRKKSLVLSFFIKGFVIVG